MIAIEDIRKEKIKHFRETEILIVGCGTAGSVAAIRAAREKKDVLVVEELGYPGGTQTAALVTPQMPNLYNGQNLNGGIDLEIHELLAKRGEAASFADGNPGWFNPEALKFLLEELLLECGAKLLYFTKFEDSIMDGNKIKGAVVLTKNGREAIMAGRVIDATGDGDVAFRAGAPFEKGEGETGKNQPFSVRFLMAGVEVERLLAFLQSLGRVDIHRSVENKCLLLHTAMLWNSGWPLEPLFRRAVEEGVLLEKDGNYFQFFTVPGRPGEVAFNCPRISSLTDGTDADHLSLAMQEGRAAIVRYVRFLKKYLPGFENSYLSSSSSIAGVRESRRIKGEYYLTARDIFEGRKFEDAVARSSYPIDIHRDPEEKKEGLIHLPPGTFYEIPYRCLVPLYIENLLVAGRCLSASFEAQASVRIQSNCRALGEAAGLASVISIKKGIFPRHIEGAELREELIKRGARLSKISLSSGGRATS